MWEVIIFRWTHYFSIYLGETKDHADLQFCSIAFLMLTCLWNTTAMCFMWEPGISLPWKESTIASGQHRNLEILGGKKYSIARSNLLFCKVSEHFLEMLVQDTDTCCSVLIVFHKQRDQIHTVLPPHWEFGLLTYPTIYLIINYINQYIETELLYTFSPLWMSPVYLGRSVISSPLGINYKKFSSLKWI